MLESRWLREMEAAELAPPSPRGYGTSPWLWGGGVSVGYLHPSQPVNKMTWLSFHTQGRYHEPAWQTHLLNLALCISLNDFIRRLDEVNVPTLREFTWTKTFFLVSETFVKITSSWFYFLPHFFGNEETSWFWGGQNMKLDIAVLDTLNVQWEDGDEGVNAEMYRIMEIKGLICSSLQRLDWSWDIQERRRGWKG